MLCIHVYRARPNPGGSRLLGIMLQPVGARNDQAASRAAAHRGVADRNTNPCSERPAVHGRPGHRKAEKLLEWIRAETPQFEKDIEDAQRRSQAEIAEMGLAYPVAGGMKQ